MSLRRGTRIGKWTHKFSGSYTKDEPKFLRQNILISQPVWRTLRAFQELVKKSSTGKTNRTKQEPGLRCFKIRNF